MEMNVLHCGEPGNGLYVITDKPDPWQHEAKPGAVTYGCQTLEQAIEIITETAILDHQVNKTKTFSVRIEL
jgi:hypothetical protein